MTRETAAQVQALFVDSKRGPYPALLGADACWDESRDAKGYAGPNPVTAHPPCGPWGRYAWKCKQDASTGPAAVASVRAWGGVLEHPTASKLWAHCGMPRPGELPDAWGGYTVEVAQRDFGHRADKETWLYVVGCAQADLPPLPPSQPKREAWTPSRRVLDPKRLESARPRGTRGILECLSKGQRHLTPPAFAAWLVDVAQRCKRGGR